VVVYLSLQHLLSLYLPCVGCSAWGHYNPGTTTHTRCMGVALDESFFFVFGWCRASA